MNIAESTCLPISTSFGLGSATTTNQIIGLSTSAVGATGSILAASGAFAAIPIAGPFIAAAAALTGIIASFFQGCGNTCVEATQIVNQIEPYLQQNLANYQALPIPRTQAEQQAAEAVFNNAWSQVLAACGNPALGTAGQNCISQRAAGGSIPNHPGVNWFTLYYNPIANDPNVAPNTTVSDLTGGTVAGSSTAGTGTGTNTDMEDVISNIFSNPLVLIGVVAVIGGFMFIGEK